MNDYFYGGLLRLLVTLTHWVIVLSMSGLWQWFISLFNNSLVTTLVGALIGGYATFRAVQYQIEQQREADKRKEEAEEQNKLRYLLFLLDDINTTISTYGRAAIRFTNSVSHNIYVIPDMLSHNSHSLQAVASKINQEEYYLSALRQLADSDFPEVFRMLNSLEIMLKNVQTHYREQFPLLVQAKQDFGESADEIPQILASSIKTGSYATHGPGSGPPPDLTSLQSYFNGLFTTYPDILDVNRLAGIDNQLPLLEHYFKTATIHSKEYLSKVSLIVDKNRHYRSRMGNVANSIATSRTELNWIMGLVQPHGNTLREYISALPSRQSSGNRDGLFKRIIARLGLPPKWRWPV